MTNTPFIIVEIPHQHPAKAWIAWDGKASVIKAAHTETCERYMDMCYYKIDLAEAIESHGDDVGDWPEGLADALAAHGEVIDVNGEFVPVSDAPTEYEWAKDVLFHDLHLGKVLETVEDVARFIADAPAHQQFTAIAAVQREYENAARYMAVEDSK